MGTNIMQINALMQYHRGRCEFEYVDLLQDVTLDEECANDASKNHDDDVDKDGQPLG